MNAPSNSKNKFYVRPNDDWVCSCCDSPSCGGCGEHGAAAEPCIPTPSLRLRRGMLTLGITALTTGFLIALFVSPARNDLLAPGPLTHAHAQILASSGSQRCDSCHGAGDRTLVDWMQDAVGAGKHIPVSQSSLCMDCHNKTLLQQFALLPHNVEPGKLAAVTASTRQTTMPVGISNPASASGELACATCHREHHGANFNLSALTDRQCQTCHTNYIHSFEKDHPEFTSWPDQQNRRIPFDHTVHSLKHFPEKGTTFDCRQCHIDDAGGNVKLVAPFSQSCAQCHSAEVYEPESPKWTFLQLPMLDTAALTNAGKSVGDWPAACDGDFDGQIPPAMKLLLSTDSTIAAILKRRGENFAFSDLDPNKPGDLDDASRIAWAIKALIFDLANSTDQTFQQRLQMLTGSMLLDARRTIDWSALSAGLHPDLFAQAQQFWMPELSKELSLRSPVDPAGSDPDRNVLFGRANLPLQEDDDLLVENPLTSLMKGMPAPVAPDVAATSDADRQPVVINQSDNTSSDGMVTNPHVDPNRQIPGGDDKDLLVQNPLNKPGPLVKNANPADAINSGISPKAPAIKSLSDSQFAEQIRSNLRRREPQQSNDHGSGWARNDRSFSVTYLPVRHIDPVMKAWTDYSTVFANIPDVQTSGIHNSLNSPAAAGACMRCHTTSNNSNVNASVVEWSPQYRDPNVRDFTRFSHQPHDSITGLSDCQSCHSINKNHVSLASSISGKSLNDFVPIAKGTCANCHRPGGAPSGCVDCHNYHVGSKVLGK